MTKREQFVHTIETILGREVLSREMAHTQFMIEQAVVKSFNDDRNDIYSSILRSFSKEMSKYGQIDWDAVDYDSPPPEVRRVS